MYKYIYIDSSARRPNRNLYDLKTKHKSMTIFGWMPRFTFSHFTRDPNLHNPHLHKTQIYTTPNLHKTQIYMPPDLHRLEFTKPRFTQTQIYTASIIHKTQIFTVPNLHRPQFYNTKSAPILQHQISPNISFKGKDNLILALIVFEKLPFS